MNTSIKMDKNILLVQNGFLAMPNLTVDSSEKLTDVRTESVGTILSNMAYYGYVPSAIATTSLLNLSDAGLYEFWEQIQPALAYASGEDRNIGDFVVYKNFPKEVLDMSESQYWIQQIFMYWGLPSAIFAQEVEEREPLTDKLELKVLDLVYPDTLEDIYARLKQVSVKWTDFQAAQAAYLTELFADLPLNMDDFTFKANGVDLISDNIKAVIDGGRTVSFSTATDVLRLAAALSGGDVTLRVNTKFRKFSRPERRFLVSLLNGASNLEADFGIRPEPWKRLISNLHPAEFRYERVTFAINALYNKEIKTISSSIEDMFASKDPAVLSVLQSQPGQFLRRLHQAYAAFGFAAVEAFTAITDDLTVAQLLKLDGYLKTVNDRKVLMPTPKGLWRKVQMVPNSKKKIEEADLNHLRQHISQAIGARLNALHPNGFNVAADAGKAKLQGSGQELAPYGRGTVFDIPENMTFIRTASYWKAEEDRPVWFDVGCNFFDNDWKPVGTICWDTTHTMGKGAVFSGDPMNVTEEEGRACQIIDLNIDQLRADRARYVVWNILCYSRIPFSTADEVMATLQWGENPHAGQLYEPARAQAVFPITGDDMTKFVFYIDLQERKLVFMDAALPGSVHSARHNEDTLAELMPAFIEYLDAQPSVSDLFSHALPGTTPVVFNDADVEIDGPAYVFERKNAANKVEAINMEEILNAKGDVVLTEKEDIKQAA